MIVAFIKPKKGKEFVAGIFEDHDSLNRSLKDNPLEPGEVMYLERPKLRFPFYIRETEGKFSIYQTCWKALETMQPWDDATIYRIDKEFWPNTAWSDEMGRLNHHHICGAEE